jgi:NADH pyrophosphatase NudC (nudix superfamily)
MSEDLIAQRDRLLEKFTVMQADLGGAFYEMAIRDHVRMDALTRKAAELQRVDAELLAVERLLELERDDAAGSCPSCGAPFGPAARFCGQCGHTLAAREEGMDEAKAETKKRSEAKA